MEIIGVVQNRLSYNRSAGSLLITYLDGFYINLNRHFIRRVVSNIKIKNIIFKTR